MTRRKLYRMQLNRCGSYRGGSASYLINPINIALTKNELITFLDEFYLALNSKRSAILIYDRDETIRDNRIADEPPRPDKDD